MYGDLYQSKASISSRLIAREYNLHRIDADVQVKFCRIAFKGKIL